MSAFFLTLKIAFHFVPSAKSSKRKGPLAFISLFFFFFLTTFTLPLFCSQSQPFPLGILSDSGQFTQSTLKQP